MESKRTVAYDDPSKTFLGVRFILLGFDSTKEEKVRLKLLEGGGIDAVNYGPNCNHVIVDKLVYDDPICIAARRDGKTLVNWLWVDHSFDVGMPVENTSVMYRPVRNLNGIPGAKSMVVCLTGYQRQDREDIMIMVALMGAIFSKPLVANRVTHLICYKFEGEKYELAKRLEKIKLVNHLWLEDCLKAWELLPEEDYNKSGYELEMMAEAKDSEEETEDMARVTDLGRKNVEIQRYSLPSSASKSSGNGETSKIHVTPAGQDGSHDRHLQMKTPFSAKSPEKKSSALPSSSSKSSGNGETSKIHATPAGQDGIHDRHLEMTTPFSAKNPGKKSSPLPSNMLDSTNISEMSPADMSKLSKKSLPFKGFPSMKIQSKSGCPLASDANKYGVSGGFDIDYVVKTPLKGTTTSALGYEGQIAKSPNRSDTSVSRRGGSKSPMMSCHIGDDEGETAKLLNKNKRSITRGNSKSPMLSRETDCEGKRHLKETSPPGDEGNTVKSANKSKIRGGSKSPMPSRDPAVVMESKLMTNSVDEFSSKISTSCLEKLTPSASKEALANSCKRLKEQTLLVDLETNNCSVGVGIHQSDMLQSIRPEPPVKRTNSVVDKMDDLDDPEFTTDGNMSATSEPLPKKLLAKKTLGSKRAISKGSTTKLKGTLDLQKSISQNESVVHPNRALAMAEEITDNATAMDDDTSAPSDIVRNEDEVPPVGKCDTDLEKEAPKNIIQTKENSIEADKAIYGERPELTESRSKGDVGGKKIAKAKKRPLSNAKKNQLKFSGEESKKDEKREDMKSVQGNGETVVIEGKTKSRPSKKLKCSGKVQNEDEIPPMEKCDINSETEASENIMQTKENSFEADRTVHGEKTELTESKSNDNAGDEKIPKAKKRPLANAKKNQLKGSVEESNKNEKQEKKKSVSSNEETAVLDCKTKKRPSKKLKKSSGESKKEKSTTVKLLKSVAKAGETDLDSGKCNKLEMIDEPACFIVSGHRLQRKDFQQLIRRLKGRVCRDTHSWSYQATHFIVPDPVKRTEKFFAAAASGSWILKTDYLTACNEAGRFLAEEPYEWHKKCLTEDGAINLEAPRKWRLLREKTGHGAFYGMRIVIYGECIAPPLDTLKRVIKAGDGTILATSPPYTRFFESRIDFAIVSPSMPRVDMWVQEFLRHEVPCVLADYLVEYVCKPGYSLEKHVQYNTHVWAQRSLENSVNRVEETTEDVSTPLGQCADDTACKVCGSQDRGDEMLICGDESGNFGCGVGIHFDCLDPPLVCVPEEDWFCMECRVKRDGGSAGKKPKKRASKSKK